MKLEKIEIQRYRSIAKLSVKIENGTPLIICGSNNVGKTNFLRALDLFFSLDKDKFDKDRDIPYDIAEGRSTGGRYKTTFRAVLSDDANKYDVKLDFKWNKTAGNELEIKGFKNKTKITSGEVKNLIKQFRFIFVEASNINMPRIIDEIIDDEILPMGLDSLRARQSAPLKVFRSFIDKSQKSVERIEAEVGEILNEFITDIPGIDTKDWRIEILFSKYKKLREAISGMIDFTLYDKNKRTMESKGSGIQRIVFLSLIKYMTNHSKKKIIWGIDEPEAFLQPALQKRVFEILCDIAKKQGIFITTHSPHFVNLRSLGSTELFQARYSERSFAKKQDEIFYKVETYTKNVSSENEKIQDIKEHLGLHRNDGWQVLPRNIIVEGEEDKKYLETIISSLNLPLKNIIWAGGASKIGGYLQYYNNCAKELSFKPEFLCLFDEDDEGREQAKRINPSSYRNMGVRIVNLPRFDGMPKEKDAKWEIEDFLPPALVFSVINKVLKKNKYQKITLRQSKDRIKTVHKNKQILKYANECCEQNNPDLSPMHLESEGRKKEICLRFCEGLTPETIVKTLTNDQKEFITQLVI